MEWFDLLWKGATIILATMALLAAVGSALAWFIRTSDDRKDFKEFMQEIRKDIKDLSQTLNQVVGILIRGGASDLSLVAEGASPLKLNELGRKISGEINAKDWALTLAKTLNNQVSGMSAYDIQEFCFGYVTEDTLGKAEVQKVKDVAFNHGVSIYTVLRVMALELRDCLLERENIVLPS